MWQSAEDRGSSGVSYAQQDDRNQRTETALPSIDFLKMLWEQSAALRASSIEVQSMSMEARALARNLRMQRERGEVKGVRS